VILWICESKSREKCPQTAEKRERPRRGDPRELAKATSKEKHLEDKEGYRKVV